MQNLSTTNQIQPLFERGLVYPEQKESSPVEIRRGMTILTQDGQEVGRVAAVVLEADHQNVTHILLARLHLTPDYRLVPIKFIKHVSEETVLLHIDSEAVERLPHRQEEQL